MSKRHLDRKFGSNAQVRIPLLLQLECVNSESCLRNIFRKHLSSFRNCTPYSEPLFDIPRDTSSEVKQALPEDML